MSLLVGCAATAPVADVAPPASRTLSLDEPRTWPGDLVIPLHAVGPYRYADVSVNGFESGRFLLDTGANRAVIDNGRANRFALPDVGGGTTTGIAGQTSTRYRQAEHLTLGPADVAGNPSQRVLVRSGQTRMIGLDMRRLGGVSAGVAGILGFRSLGNVPFTIDTEANTLTLHRPHTFRPPADATRIRLRRFHGLPVVDAQLFTRDDEAVPIRLLLDTGMNTALSLPHELIEQHPDLASVPVSGRGNSRGVGGTLASTNTWVHRTRLFGLDLRGLPAGFEAMPPQLQQRGAAPQGRVGMAVLGHFALTFDPQRNYVYARYLDGK